jgi:hypothetical protein
VVPIFRETIDIMRHRTCSITVDESMPAHIQQIISVQPTPPQIPMQPHWTAYISSIAIPIVAIFGAYIAYRQFKTAQNRLKYDLFDKRMAVYDAACKAIGIAATKGNLTGQDQIDFLVGVNSAKWLFDSKISVYLDKDLWNQIIKLEYHEKMSASLIDTQRVHHIEEKSKTLERLRAQYDTLDKLCAPYLKLEH